MTTKIKNNDAYASTLGRKITLTVEAHCDMVPGAWHEPEDLMRWIATHRYVQSVTLSEPEGDYTEVARFIAGSGGHPEDMAKAFILSGVSLTNAVVHLRDHLKCDLWDKYDTVGEMVVHYVRIAEKRGET